MKNLESKSMEVGKQRRPGAGGTAAGSFLNEMEAGVRRTVEVYGQITAIVRCLELARSSGNYMARELPVQYPVELVKKNPEAGAILRRATGEQARSLAVDLFRLILGQVPEDAPAALRRQVDLFDTTFGLGINEGKANSMIAMQRYGISREAWEQAQDRLCKSLGIARPITRNSKQDTTKNRLRNHRHVKSS